MYNIYTQTAQSPESSYLLNDKKKAEQTEMTKK